MMRFLKIRVAQWVYQVCGLILLAATSTAALSNTNGTGTHDIAAVTLDNEQAFAVCVYPTSGQYCFLNRLLFYCLLIFSLFSRAHLWLVAGALAAALTYSGAAAIHACLLVWRGPNPYIDNDSWALYLILSTSCLITVPLLNWSGTLRRLGARAASLRDHKALQTNSSSGTRTVVVYWAFLVLVAYICIWQQIFYGAHDLNNEYPDMKKVMCQAGTNGSSFLDSNGTFHRRAVDQQFIMDNGCTNPCNQVNIPAIFRTQSQLQLLTHEQALLWNYTIPGAKYERLERLQTAENGLLTLTYYALPFILVQGFIAACFGRRGPREVRDLIYIKLFLEHPWSSSAKSALVIFQDWATRTLAILSYSLAALTIIVCPPLFVLIIIAQEWSDWVQVPDSDSLSDVGQWEPWASAGLAILGALIARYHDRAVYNVAYWARRSWHALRNRHHRQQQQQQQQKQPQQSARPSVATTLQDGGLSIDPEKGAATTTSTAPPSPCSKADPSVVPASPPNNKPTVAQKLNAAVKGIRHMLSHPLNQSDTGLLDEMLNFGRWCANPGAVSRLVVRHPLRPSEEVQMGFACACARNCEGECKCEPTQEAGSAASGNVQGRYARSTDAATGHEKQHQQHQGSVEERPEFRERLDSGFFRGASLRR